VANGDSQDIGLQHHEISKKERAACFSFFWLRGYITNGLNTSIQLKNTGTSG